MRVGVAHHLGWAIVVVATAEHDVADRRRIELLEAGLPAAPIHHEGGAHPMHRSGPPLDDHALAALVADVRASALRRAHTALDELARDAAAPITSLSVRTWPDDLPDDIAILRRPPLESRVDSYLYCQVLAEAARARGWAVHRYDAKRVEADAAAHLGPRAADVLDGPRKRLGPPWTKDHRTALAATVIAGTMPST